MNKERQKTTLPLREGRTGKAGAGWGKNPAFAHHKNRPTNIQRAHELRQSGSIIERILWREIRKQAKSYGLRFRYQHPVDPYIVDFACLSARLIVEIDGMSHDATHVADEKRQRYLERQGFHVLRFMNADFMRDISIVITTVCERAYELQQARQQTPPRTRISACDPPARGGS